MPVAGPGKLVKYSGLAGEKTLEAYAHEEALHHFQKGLTAMGIDPEAPTPAADDDSAALLFDLGRSQAPTFGNSVSKTTEAIGNLKRAFEHYRQTGQLERALQVAEYSVRPQAGYQV